MSRTLFWYIFRDLVRIFLLTCAVLAGIMSFGGLLRPLYEFGLDLWQVGKILSWSVPAMTAYSLPIAALFATTIVYGRLGADNEITACRVAGISHLSLTLPAMILGLLTAFVSLGMLCFIVPASMLKVEQIVYSNLARLVSGQIQRSHQIRFDHANQSVTVFAHWARVLPPDPDQPHTQAVQLDGPMIVTYEPGEKGQSQTPEYFYMARSATAFIRQDFHRDQVSMWAQLDGGVMFPRRLAGQGRRLAQASVGTTRFGPVPLPSPIRENTKFMDVLSLRQMLDHPEKSRKISSLLRAFITRDQQRQYLEHLARQLNGPDGWVELSGSGETYRLERGAAVTELARDRLVIHSEPPAQQPRLVQFRDQRRSIEVQAEQIRVRAFADPDRGRIALDIEMLGCMVYDGQDWRPRENFSRPLSVPMPPQIASMTTRPASYYVSEPDSTGQNQRKQLQRELVKLTNSAISELHARASFAVSCFALVMVGCALGMMFCSGNFLGAFALSVAPALLSIALIVTGQHTCENVPPDVGSQEWSSSLKLGLWLIWSGNAAVAAIAAVLLGKLQKQ